MIYISMALCKKDVTPLLTHWSYVFLALNHWYKENGDDIKLVISNNIIKLMMTQDFHTHIQQQVEKS